MDNAFSSSMLSMIWTMAQFNKFYELKKMNNQKIVYDKLVPQLNDLVFIFHGLRSLHLHRQLEKGDL